MAQATIPALVAEKTNNGILKARRRIRPVTVRFTEPGIADLTTELVAETLYEIRQTRRQQGLEDTASVGYSTDIKRNGKARKVDAGVSDRADDDDDSSDSDSSSSTASTDTVRGASGRSNTTQNHHRPCITVLRSTDETVGSFRARIYQSHLPPDFQRRQVRLIHAGRILKDDGIKLVDWLDTLDEKRESSLLGIEGSSEQRPGAGAAATVNSRKDEQAREGEALVRELAKQGRRARKQALRTAKNIGGWIEDRATKALADVGAGPHSPLLPLSVPAKETHVLFDSDTLEDEIAKKKPENRPSRQTSKGKGRATEADMARWLQPSNLTVEESRASNTVYIQCSIGPEMDVDQIRQRKEEQTQAQQGRATLSWPSDNQEAFASGSTRQQYSGFDRLRETAGLNASDISTMRYHFRHARPELLLDRSGDVLRRAEEDEHARALEEQWIDGMVGAQNGRDDGGTAGSASGSQSSRTTLFGMMIGFFFPVLPLFFLSDKPHPSWFPSINSHPRLTDSDSEDDGDDDDEDADAEGDRRREGEAGQDGDGNGYTSGGNRNVRSAEERLEVRRAQAAQRRALRGGTVFGAPLQNAIFMGIMANLFFALFKNFFAPD